MSTEPWAYQALVVQGEQMQPTVVEQRADLRVTFEDVGDRFGRRFDQHGEAQRLVGQALAVMHRLPRQSGAQDPAVALDYADAAGDVVQQLVAGAKTLGRDGRSVVLQADPAGDDDRCGQDQLQHAEAVVVAPVVVVEEGAPGQVAPGSARARCGDEGLAAGKCPFGANLGPVAGAMCDVLAAVRAGQALGTFRPRQRSGRGQPLRRLGEIFGMPGRRVIGGVEGDRIGRGVVQCGQE